MVLQHRGRPTGLAGAKRDRGDDFGRGLLNTEEETGRYRVRVHLPAQPWRDIFDGSSLNTGTQLYNKLKRSRRSSLRPRD